MIKTMNIDTFLNLFRGTDFQCNVNGKHYAGYYSDENVPEGAVPEGYHKYLVRTSDKCGKLATIENAVVVNFGGTIITTEEIPLTESYNGNHYANIEDYTINLVPYQVFPQILKEIWKGYKVSAAEYAVIKDFGKEMKEHNDYDNGYHAFKLNCTYDEADALVNKLNELNEDEDTDLWYLGDCHEIYVDVD